MSLETHSSNDCYSYQFSDRRDICSLTEKRGGPSRPASVFALTFASILVVNAAKTVVEAFTNGAAAYPLG